MKNRNSRQSFLGINFDEVMSSVRVGIVGYSGGGSHIGQLLAHYGFMKYFICDPDIFEEVNIHRLIGGRFEDIALKTPKVDIGERVIKGILPDSEVIKAQSKWQECITDPKFLECKVIFAGLDDFATRVQLESFCRAKGIILIDIGMSVKESENRHYSMGQVIMSHPEGPCFKCLDFITDKDLELEATKYGDVGIRQQVASINGTLANTAVTLGVQLLSDWIEDKGVVFYKTYDGNNLDLMNHPKVNECLADGCKCTHFR
ncbi:ThiF family adenylyltransferase [Halobacteriovorax sp. ZH1_bin.1]|uniref:ThiF family adenylyltransferase n=1 Tax=Halobacteriovorax sp. ZH1_bin.1 TaxID=3157723 RepID=UPI00371412BF